MRLVLARVVTRREAEPIARDRGRVLHEQHHHLLAPLQHRQVERRVALSVGGVDLGLVLDELQRGLLEAVARAQVERRLAARVSGAHVRARGDELLHHRLGLAMRGHARQVQRPPQALLLGGVDVGAVGDEPGEQLAVRRRRVHGKGVVQRVAADGVHLVELHLCRRLFTRGGDPTSSGGGGGGGGGVACRPPRPPRRRAGGGGGGGGGSDAADGLAPRLEQ